MNAGEKQMIGCSTIVAEQLVVKIREDSSLVIANGDILFVLRIVV